MPLSRTAAIPATLRAGKSAVKTLNAIFRQIYKGNHEVLAAWKSASHEQREPKSTTPPTPRRHPRHNRKPSAISSSVRP